jgi:hypothetical protein
MGASDGPGLRRDLYIIEDCEQVSFDGGEFIADHSGADDHCANKIIEIVQLAYGGQQEISGHSMTVSIESGNASRVGRKKLWGERIMVRFPDRTRGRIEAVLRTGEDLSAVIRKAVELELRRREKSAAAKAKRS